MAMEGLVVMVCAGALAAGTPNGGNPADDRDAAVATALAVQTALQQGREHLLRNNPRAAVEILETQLPHINGSAAYLGLLKEAYRGLINQLRLANQEPAAQVYVRRLLILEPESAGRLRAAVPRVAASVVKTPAPAPGTLRAKGEDEDDFFKPAGPRPADKAQQARRLLLQAEDEFGKSRFRQAAALFEQAHQLEPGATQNSAARWAYCKLDHVVEQLNERSTALAALEAEVREALELAPNLEFGRELLREIDRRRAGPQAGAGGDSDAEDLPVDDRGRDPEGWSLVETSSFRVHYAGDRQTAVRAARIAERTRAEMQRKWFGTLGPAWSPKCDLYLYATAQDYSRATDVPPTSPGHSSFDMDGGRVLRRRIHLHCDDSNLLTAVLPHEATHAVLAGNFGDRPVPHWADEGIAVLTEPREKVERHLRQLPRFNDEGQLFSLRQLLQMDGYPDPRYVAPFYAESVSVVEFLSKEKDPQVFTRFVRDGLRGGFESALQAHYGFRDVADLERAWRDRTFGHAGR